MFIKINNIKNGFQWKFTEPKNSYRWVPMMSGHGTEKLFSMGFEILGLVILLLKISMSIKNTQLINFMDLWLQC